jgi:hypothetical protein
MNNLLEIKKYANIHVKGRLKNEMKNKIGKKVLWLE